MAQRGRPPSSDVLTPAEWEVVHLVRHGVTNRRIAELRGTSLDAVKSHIEHARAKLGVESRIALRHWRGIPSASPMRSATVSATASSSIALGHIGQVSVTVADVERAVTFYRDTLGIAHLFTNGDLAFMDADGTRIMLDALPEARGQGTSVLYFTVPEIHAAVDALTARGVTFSGAPHMIFRHPDGTEEWMAFFADPDGNLLALMSKVAPS